MKAGAQSLSLHFAGREPNTPKGNILQVTAVVAGRDMAVAASSTFPPNAASASSAIFATLQAAASSLLEVRWPALALIILFTFALLQRLAGRKKFVRQFATCAVLALFALNPTTTFGQSSACTTPHVQS